MKRHVQFTGIRKWSGSDLLELQSETLRVLDGFLSEYGAAIISGCEVTGKDIAPGIVALSGMDADNKPAKMVVPFAGAKDVSFPVYLTLSYATVERTYDDTVIKPIAYQYEAIPDTVKPVDKPYLEINETGNIRFWDIMQDSMHRFVTDAEKTWWNDKTPEEHSHLVISEKDQNIPVDTRKAGQLYLLTKAILFGNIRRGQLQTETGEILHIETDAASIRFSDGMTLQEKFDGGELINLEEYERWQNEQDTRLEKLEAAVETWLSPTIEVSTESVSFPKEGGTQEIEITCNGLWEVK